MVFSWISGLYFSCCVVFYNCRKDARRAQWFRNLAKTVALFCADIMLVIFGSHAPGRG